MQRTIEAMSDSLLNWTGLEVLQRTGDVRVPNRALLVRYHSLYVWRGAHRRFAFDRNEVSADVESFHTAPALDCRMSTVRRTPSVA